MKKVFYILASLTLAACIHDEPLEHNPELALMFQPSMYMHMSDDSVEYYPDEQPFAVRAWQLPRGMQWDEASSEAVEFLPTTTAYCSEVRITDTLDTYGVYDKLWTIDENPVWPSHDETLTFIAYSPAAAAQCTCDPVDGVVHTMDIREEQTDFLFSIPCSDRHKIKNGWIVPIIFDHALCRMDLKVSHRVAADEKITVKSIVIDSVLCKGTFRSLPSPHWTLNDTVTSFAFYEGSKEITSKPTEIGKYLLLPPQQLATAITVEYDYTTAMQTTITQKHSTVLMGATLRAGQTYTYRLSIGIDDVKFLHEIIE